ncbi:hypothetical protein GLOIN_2v1790336 [Rhizophagus irregularis DAOM 181602=DAOM 197198]|uniref:Uncharacterized protein n=3 Tax=Rhizophagus irregularis TaxID=588596 RepID=A0A015K2F3_RHIIW|nr:hypothetical protein GLOIN_2v1790336 [Rhizophagus irregularis DAOM 181602=DAOM 197198]EXX61569.1 hypothetical protein RirG_169950 [Rhizophagus irregularis DAOM 197198w]POG58468.1 hypothetical protein GLOIN_2v1790336 [Rhizophagus irregularis DAOM 181602=DAOM 197198]|eukprot:XP_025165334.1 hypothetical protein GLOIN_2v1790336 [Rhizophagus irregularis DAOM 181602=DAOM 197198]
MSYNNCIKNTMDVFAYEQNATSTHHSIDSYLSTFDNTLQDKVLDTNEQYTNLTSYVQYTTPTHFASYIAPDEQYADDVLTYLTSYTPDKYAATLAHFISNINDTALTQVTSFVTPDADDTVNSLYSHTFGTVHIW